MSVPDATVENLSDNPANWLRAVFWIMVPVESRLFSRTSINLRIQHRRDTGVVWAIGIADGSGSFQKKIGKLSPADNVMEAVTLLGEPIGGRQTAPIVDEYFWLTDDLAYFARFLSESNADFTGRMREKGTQINLEVIAVRHAPRGYLDARAEERS
ncbi:MAG TPA: hypothetical protein VI391_04720 [Thermoanaerobaculia bacterium]